MLVEMLLFVFSYVVVYAIGVFVGVLMGKLDASYSRVIVSVDRLIEHLKKTERESDDDV